MSSGIVVVVDGDCDARDDPIGVDGGFAHLSVLQHLSELADSGFLMTLLLAGGVVAAVLGQVALFASLCDLRGNPCGVPRP